MSPEDAYALGKAAGMLETVVYLLYATAAVVACGYVYCTWVWVRAKWRGKAESR